MNMKRFILCLLLTFLIIPLKSEELYGNATRWIITGKMYDGNEYMSYAEFEISGDTVVDGVSYRKIYLTYSGKKPLLTAVIRETSDSVIYVRTFDLQNYNQGLSAEGLLFDFSMWNKGCMRLSESNFNSGDISIENITFDNSKLSQVMLADGTNADVYYGDDMTIVRGIGCVDYWGPALWMSNIEIAPSVDPCPYLYRFYRNGRLLYEDKKSAPTNIDDILTDNLTISPVAGALSVILGAVTDWSATLYNSNGVTVAQQQGSGSEIFLPTDSKGTHILVVKAGDKVVKKKVLLR
jgi:hypothetical protein